MGHGLESTEGHARPARRGVRTTARVWNRYYSGVATWDTTTSCGRNARRSLTLAIALVLSLLGGDRAAAQAPRAAFDPPLVPAELAWRVALESPPAQPPVAAGETLIVSLRSGALAALSLARGTPLWSIEQPTTVGLATDEAHAFVAHERSVSALRLTSGELVWTKTLEAPVSAPLVARGGWLLALDGAGALVAFRAADGELVWRRPLPGEPGDRGATIVGETVIVGRKTGELFALAIATGAPLWEVSLDGQPGQPLLTDGRVILGSTDNALYCLDERTGRLVWRWRTGGDVRAAPVADATHIYYVSLDNMLRAIDRRSGNLRWKRGLAARATTGLQLVSDQLLVSGLAPQVRAHRIADGRPVGTLDVPTDLLAVPPLLVPRPAPDYVLLVVAGRDGVIFAYRPTLSLLVTPLETLPGLPVELFAPDSVIEATTAPR